MKTHRNHHAIAAGDAMKNKISFDNFVGTYVLQAFASYETASVT